ncbi:MAG: thiolase family protein, partial [Chloroflexota bacterium]
DADVVLAGGAENMSNLPYYVLNARWGYRLGHGAFLDWFSDASETVSGPPERCGKLSMGLTAENVAARYGLTRQDLDAYALRSQEKAREATAADRFREEIVPVEVAQGKNTVTVDTDEHPRPDTTLEKLAKLPAIFQADGMVTAGNACGMNDAAAVTALISREKAAALGMKPWARLVSYAVAGVDPAFMGIGPVPATDRALEKAGLEMKDIDLIELNEAFAAQAEAVIREWEQRGMRSRDIVNVNGGAIALGHPIGATGARLVTTLIYEMRRRGLRYGLASACVGGGMGATLIIEREA